MNNDKLNGMWDALLEMGVTEQTLQIVTSGWGYSQDTLETVLYAHTGLRSFDQADDDEERDPCIVCGTEPAADGMSTCESCR